LSLSSRGSARTALLLLLLAALLPASAEAHQRLLGAAPAAGSELGAVPRELRLRFNEPVELAFTRVRLVGPDGAPVAVGEQRLSRDSANVLIVPIPGSLRSGSYTVQWSTASRDGHPVSGEYGFVIAADADGVAADRRSGGEYGAGVTAPGQPTPPAEHHDAAADGADAFQADSPAYVLVRWVNYIALLGVIGAVAFRLLVLGVMRRRHPDDQLARAATMRAATAGVVFATLVLLAALGRLYAQSLALHGAADVLDSERIATLLRSTVWGWAWQIQIGAAVAALVAFVRARRSPGGGIWAVAAVAALALAVTPALSGHAAAMTGATGTLAIVTDALHVVAAAGWLGTLLVLVICGIPAAASRGAGRRGPAVAALVRSFSPVALLFATVLVLTGITATVIHSSSLAALLGSRYGTLLLIKLGIFALVFGTGAYNFLRLQPSLGDDVAAGRLKRSAGVELGVAAGVLLVTAVLVATARPYDEAVAARPGVTAPAGAGEMTDSHTSGAES
jgi:putative copper export protein/methionine-rich copper-binding protein CopC